VLDDLQIPVTSIVLDQAQRAIDRKLLRMVRFYHPLGSHHMCLQGLAHLCNLVPYQRGAWHAGQCGVEGEGGQVPTPHWILTLQILTSGGFR
jgi:N-acetyl-anhydromuramyl-L-alanine amidase AmpD